MTLVVESDGLSLARLNDDKPYRINVAAIDGVLDRIIDVGCARTPDPTDPTTDDVTRVTL